MMIMAMKHQPGHAAHSMTKILLKLCTIQTQYCQLFAGAVTIRPTKRTAIMRCRWLLLSNLYPSCSHFSACHINPLPRTCNECNFKVCSRQILA
jgi:hypothetical protein